MEQVSDFTDTIERINLDTGFCFNAHPMVNSVSRHYTDGDLIIDEQIIKFKDIVLKKSVKKGRSGTKVENYIKTPDDIDKIFSLPYKPAEPDPDMFLKKRIDFGERGLMGVSFNDPISVFHNLCMETDFPLYIMDETKKIYEFLEVMFERIYHTLEFLLKKNIGPVFWMDGPEYVTPPMISPDFFYDLAVKYDKRLFDLIRNYGMKSMLHCHGNIKKVLPGLNQMGFDSIHPVEAPPMGDCPLPVARAVFGKNVIITGNIQYGDLWNKTEEEMEQLVKTVIEEGREGRFILATTGGPSSKEINDTVIKNYSRIIETAMHYGKL
ncbi:MAG: hypothetical protein FWD78_08300 [Treponema sp.]|nr:hypothetical protein [Treponema sp.]